ncbi:hypothetical protein Syun_021850 [Stephania yunnanensis]|uniref:Glycosyltransferase 61 catalytic domain-containing protein n=1 Tax=Stephania yunnanensis TaxID=152371 RepID=A0AAP0IHD0_9MAGN
MAAIYLLKGIVLSSSHEVFIEFENAFLSPVLLLLVFYEAQDSSYLFDKDVKSVKKHELIKPVCNLKEPRSNFCEMNGDIRIHGNASTVFFSSPQVDVLEQNKSWKIKPYARKGDRAAMRSVSEFSVRSFAAQSDAPSCVVNHSVPAIVFSVAGYSSNIFHTFSELLIPLFITSRHFHGEVQFLATDGSRSSWASKYKPVLDKLSRYEIINIDREDKIHCFPSMTVGLKLHKEFRIDPLIARNEYSIKDFRKLLWSAYSLKRAEAIRIRHRQRKKPRLLILTRRRTRSFTNEEEIFELATSLGFEVILAEPALMDLAKFADIVNSCDIMMGVHGAGLTNLAFLPSNAVLIQVVPLGGLQWVSRHYYAEPAMDMGISYLEYNIEENESTLIEQYPRDDAVFKDPLSIQKQGWAAVKAIYFNKQNVMLNVSRFRATLLEALQLLHHAH